MTATTPTISKDNDVISFVNLFTVQSEEEQQQLINLLIKATEVMCNQEGFVSANIQLATGFICEVGLVPALIGS
jgi:hypothetical protein